MNWKQIIRIVFSCLIFGGLAILFFVDAHKLIYLKRNHEVVSGVIEKVTRGGRGGYTYNMTFSYEYKGQTYTKIASLSSYPEYSHFTQRAPFLLNYEKNFIFPQNEIDSEIRTLLLFAVILTIVLIIAIGHEIIFKREKKSKIKTDKTITPINPLNLNYNETWTCKKCGEKNPVNLTYCKDCGEYK